MLISDFCKYVLSDVPGCPSVTARQAVLDAATQFLTDSRAWTEVQDPITVAASQQSYDLDAPTGARCIDIKAIYAPWMVGGKLLPTTVDVLSREMPQWQTAQSNLPNRYTRALDFTTFSVYPLPTTLLGETMSVHAVYTLSDTATTIPDDIVVRYRETIAAGAKARLQIMRNKPWSDDKGAIANGLLFKNGVTKAKIDAIHEKTSGSLYAKPRKFGRY